MRVDLDELERLEKAAIDSPWKHSDRDGSIIHYPKDRGPDGINHSHVVDNAFGATGALIAATRNALPALIAELRAARECARVLRCAYEVDAIKDWFDDVPGGAGGKASLEAYKRATKGDG